MGKHGCSRVSRTSERARRHYLKAVEELKERRNSNKSRLFRPGQETPPRATINAESQ